MSDEEPGLVEEFDKEEPVDTEPPAAVNETDCLRILEALLFASDEQLTSARLKTILPGGLDARQIRKMVDKINVQLQKERHPFEIVEIGGGYQFRTVSYYHPWVRRIFKDKAAKKLSIQALECLAIISYKQPISKAEIELIRGVVSDGAMKTLLEKRLVTISGRSEKPGRPFLYSTTNEFLTYFGLNRISDLPQIEEFEAIAREKMEELSIEELQKVEDTLTEEEAVLTGEKPDENDGKKPEGTAVFEVDVADTTEKMPADVPKLTNSNSNMKEHEPEPEESVEFEVKADAGKEARPPMESKDSGLEQAQTEPAAAVSGQQSPTDGTEFIIKESEPEQTDIAKAEKEETRPDDEAEFLVKN